MESTCLVCLEPIKENPAPNPIGCSCKILLHPACFQQWFDQKQQLECPLCHTIALPTILAHNIHIVYVNTTETENAINQNRQRQQQKRDVYLGICCCGLLFWTLLLVILEIQART
jgi:hypothetical protein